MIFLDHFNIMDYIGEGSVGVGMVTLIGWGVRQWIVSRIKRIRKTEERIISLEQGHELQAKDIEEHGRRITQLEK